MTKTKQTKHLFKTQIPSDWEVKTLKDLCEICYGKEQKSVVSENGEYNIYGTGGIVGKSKMFLYEKPSILIGRKGSIDLPTLIEKPFWAIDTTYYTKIKSGVSIHWLLFKLLSIGLKKFNEASGVPSLSRENLYKISFSLPSLPEQRAIARVLSTWDEAIGKTQQLIAQKEQRKKWLMQNLLTGKKRLRSASGQEFSGKWKEYHLGDFIVESRIPSIVNDVNNRITVKLNLKGVEKRDVKGSEVEDATYFFVRKKGQFIYGKQNLYKGALGIIPDELDGFESSQDIPAFDFKDGINPSFFLLFMSEETFYKSLERISTGTGSKRIHPENLYKVKVKFPSHEEQTAIAQVLQASDKEISLLKAKAEKLREQKKGLMQVLLTGKVRLKIK